MTASRSGRSPGRRDPERREPGGPGRGRSVRHDRPPRGPRRRVGLLAVAAVLSTAVVTAGVVAAYLYRGRTASAADPQAARHAPASQHLAAAESGLLPWHLPAPVLVPTE